MLGLLGLLGPRFVFQSSAFCCPLFSGPPLFFLEEVELHICESLSVSVFHVYLEISQVFVNLA